MSRAVIVEATSVLAAAGVETPRVDAELLAAHILAVTRTELAHGVAFTTEQLERYRDAVAERARRVPLQHITGEVGFRYLTLQVGPGVFVPRPETESLVEWGIGALSEVLRPVAVDLCAGSGAIALSLAHELPGARVYGVEADELAAAWFARNAELRKSVGDAAVEIVVADAGSASSLAELDGTVDLVLSNPPYVPVGSYVAPEAAEHDPALALWGGSDGLALVRRLVRRAAVLLKPGGWFGFEHGEQQAEAAAALLTDSDWDGVQTMPDLARRPRFTVGRRRAC